MNSTTLAQDQSQLLRALAGQPSGASNTLFNPRGLRVYQANRAVLAERALSSTYPVVAQLIGSESFEALARHYWQQHPPLRGDMGQWGSQLPAYLEAALQLASEPFLGDVARIEWAMHQAASAPDAVLDTASFALLAEQADKPVTLTLSPGAWVLASAFPVASLVNAHLYPNQDGQPSLAEAAAMLAQACGEYALVWRQGFKPRVRSASAPEHHLVCALQAGSTLQAALDAALAVEPAFDFSAWLGCAVQMGLITGAR